MLPGARGRGSSVLFAEKVSTMRERYWTRTATHFAGAAAAELIIRNWTTRQLNRHLILAFDNRVFTQRDESDERELGRQP